MYFVKEAVRLGGIQGELYMGGGGCISRLKGLPQRIGKCFLKYADEMTGLVSAYSHDYVSSSTCRMFSMFSMEYDLHVHFGLPCVYNGQERTMGSSFPIEYCYIQICLVLERM